MQLSIIIVSFNTRQVTLDCLSSVFERVGGFQFEVIVVDNNSADGSAQAIAEKFPQAKLITLRNNLGFAAANNLAASHAKGAYLLLLNPDTIVLESAIQNLLAFAERNPQAGIWGGRTVFSDGSLNRTSCWRRPTLWSTFCSGVGLTSLFRGSYLFDCEAYGSWQRDCVRHVDIVTGCLFMIPSDLWRQLGGFDSAFFMYGEEADLCLRARKLGFHPMITPEATIIHFGGVSERTRADKLVKLLRAKLQLFDRHWSATAAKLGMALTTLWVITRTVAWRILSWTGREKARQSFESWHQVWKRRGEWLGHDPAAGSLSLARISERSSWTGL